MPKSLENRLPLTDVLSRADNTLQAKLAIYGNALKMNFLKMQEFEFETFMDIVDRYSNLIKEQRGQGRGRKKSKRKKK